VAFKGGLCRFETSGSSFYARLAKGQNGFAAWKACAVAMAAGSGALPPPRRRKFLRGAILGVNSRLTPATLRKNTAKTAGKGCCRLSDDGGDVRLSNESPNDGASQGAARSLSDDQTTRYDPSRYSSIGEVQSRRVRAGHAYWESKRQDGAIPHRATIDPLEIPKLLPFLMLIEIADGRFRYRLVGTQAAASAGYDFTGRYLDELGFANRDFYLDCYREIAACNAPLFGFDRWVYPDGRNGVSEFAMMPLTTNGKAVTQFLTIEDSEL